MTKRRLVRSIDLILLLAVEHEYYCFDSAARLLALHMLVF